jgi:Fur family peroxide stress response transcriptional regulator
MQALRNCPPHPAADEVYRRVRDQLPSISLATVYRNLDLLTRRGLIRRLGTGGSPRRRYDPDPGEHGHFWCLDCGTVEDIPFPVSQPETDRDHPWMRQRIVYTASTDFHGLCPRCTVKAAEKRCE